MLLSFLTALLPFIGAQIFIEPGQTTEQIDGWFRTLEENGMQTCRIRMFNSYMESDDGEWDFSLFDTAFECAERHNISVWCTLFPKTLKTDIGGWKFPYDKRQKDEFASFIKAVVNHYKTHPALKGWVLINEPGLRELPDSPFIREERKEWDKVNHRPEFKKNGYPILMDVSEMRFLKDLNTKFLSWIAEEVRKYDDKHDIHINPHAIFDNYAQHSFPDYRKFLTSLGGSAHASWHFNFFDRNEYTFAMMAQSELLRSGAGELPWFMTEIQGGNNTYSGSDPLCPTPEEIKQWLWTIIGTEGKGGIFWMLNPRSSGIEAGEWAMVDYLGRPTERLKAAAEVSKVISANRGVFEDMTEISSGVDVVYFRESSWAEQLMAIDCDKYEGRRPGAVMKSSLACLRALSERGLNIGFKAFEEYDFSRNDYSGNTIILSNQIAFPEYAFGLLEHFVKCGGSLIVEGLSGFFDEDLHCIMNTGFKYASFFGETVSEFKLKSPEFTIDIDGRDIPAHLWEGYFSESQSPVVRNEYGKGRVVWIPSSIALGAWTTGNYKPLSDFLYNEIDTAGSVVSFKNGHNPGMILRSLDTDKGKLLICINKSGRNRIVAFSGIDSVAKPEVLFSEHSTYLRGKLKMENEGTIVLLYPCIIGK